MSPDGFQWIGFIAGGITTTVFASLIVFAVWTPEYSEKPLILVAFLFTILAGGLLGAIKIRSEHARSQERSKLRVDAATRAFQPHFQSDSADKTEARAMDSATEHSQKRQSGNDSEHVNDLSYFYIQQIETYQDETRKRAAASFRFAIVAMFIGLCFVALGAWHILDDDIANVENVAAGSAVSIIGGALSAYITKTFLEVHKLSLIQLNRYFQQPVINETIITAERITDNLPEDNATRAREKIVDAVISLIVKFDENDTGPIRPNPPKQRA